MQIEDYIKVGKIAAEVRENVRKKNWIGITLEDICEEVENEIIKRGAKLAFPVNTSINEIAAHYTAEPNDPKNVTDSDLIKIDLGAQINGYIADTAVTICHDTKFDGSHTDSRGCIKKCNVNNKNRCQVKRCRKND